MLYKLLYSMREGVSGFNVLGYISFRSALSAITALLISFIFGGLIIKLLEKLNIGETIRDNGPSSHFSKKGTPTMGGLLIHLSVIVPILLWANLANKYIQLTLFATVWMGAIGFLDDYLKVVKHIKEGLIARYKLLGQITLGLIVALVMYYLPAIESLGSSTSVPFLKDTVINLSFFYIPMVIIFITGFSNAVNLTDGLDGLASGLLAIVAVVLAIIAYITGRIDFSSYLNIVYLPGAGELTVFMSAMVGGMLGFLWYNAKPAQVFMGDVGSLAYGAVIGTTAVLLKKEILLIIIGGIFVIEAISVIMQVGYYKITLRKYGKGKTIFKMAPIHHHFELKGMAESKIVIRFWLIGVLLALISLATFKIR
ncbi:MAG: phospho-N-acetylmuramoyl-pentapeptide-transferase [Candidatus Marinimicrobia bacterium]|nr:phospho-N-acetylmuramoyl-pentapeptide-transferase [Candidatus Neomarinimicrobiota bacterium]